MRKNVTRPKTPKILLAEPPSPEHTCVSFCLIRVERKSVAGISHAGVQKPRPQAVVRILPAPAKLEHAGTPDRTAGAAIGWCVDADPSNATSFRELLGGWPTNLSVFRFGAPGSAWPPTFALSSIRLLDSLCSPFLYSLPLFRLRLVFSRILIGEERVAGFQKGVSWRE